MNFSQTISAIKSLKIQGAENVAIAATKAIEEFVRNSKTRTYNAMIQNLNKAKKQLIATRPTEPCMRNTLNFICNLTKNKEFSKVLMDLDKRLDYTKKHFIETKNQINKIGERKIKNGMVVFTHCHSSTVVNILKQAKKSGKKFEVHNTETRPLFQGRITSTELTKAKIPVTHYVDSAARLAIKKADIMLIGCDAITTDKVYNKIGSELMIETANRYDVPVYVCTDSWKFDLQSFFGKEELIEERSASEVWKNAPKGIKIKNPAFERISPELIAGIISELGIYRHNLFIEELIDKYYWMF